MRGHIFKLISHRWKTAKVILSLFQFAGNIDYRTYNGVVQDEINKLINKTSFYKITLSPPLPLNSSN